jgi:hypothetical protein
VHVLKKDRNKLDDKAVKGIFVGYDHKSLAYRVYVPSLQKIVVSRDVTFQPLDFSAATEFTQGYNINVADADISFGEILSESNTKPSNVSAVPTVPVHNRFEPLAAVPEHERDEEKQADPEVVGDAMSLSQKIAGLPSEHQEFELDESILGSGHNVRQDHGASAAQSEEESDGVLQPIAALSKPKHMQSREEKKAIDEYERQRARVNSMNIIEGKRERRVKNVSDEDVALMFALMAVESIGDEPVTIRQAVNDPVEGQLWKGCMRCTYEIVIGQSYMDGGGATCQCKASEMQMDIQKENWFGW